VESQGWAQPFQKWRVARNTSFNGFTLTFCDILMDLLLFLIGFVTASGILTLVRNY